MSQFPDIPPGKPWEETSSREWRNLIGYVGRVMDALGVTPTGTIGEPGSSFIIRRRRRVAIVRTIDARERPYLTVRPIRYLNDPPQVGVYEWADEPFEAYPEIGFTLSDYEPFVWTAPGPTLGMPVLDIYWQDRHWLVSLSDSGGAETLVVVRAFENGQDGLPDPGSRFLIVQEVRPTIVDGAWNGAYEAFGDTAKVNVWPALTAGHYRPFLWEPVGLLEKTTIMPLARIGGVAYCKQQPKLHVERPTGQIKQMDCTAI